MIDHEYDAIVVGAGGAGLRVSNLSLQFQFSKRTMFVLGCFWTFRGWIQDCLHLQALPNQISHCCCPGKYDDRVFC